MSKTADKLAIFGIFAFSIFAFSFYVAQTWSAETEARNQLIVAGMLAVFVLWWTFTDARSRSKRLLGYEILASLVLPPLGLLVYLLRTHSIALALFYALVAAGTFLGAAAAGTWAGINIEI